MTDLKQAAQQALEFLMTRRMGAEAVIDSLNTALEQPEQQATYWQAEAERYASNTDYWRKRCKAAEQQAESVSMRMPKVSDKVICLEDESLGTIVSLTAGGSPDIAFDDGSRGTYMLSEFAELFGYANSPAAQPEQVDCPRCGHVCSITQRQWVDLTPEQILDLFDVNNVYGSKWVEFARTVEAALWSKNT